MIFLSPVWAYFIMLLLGALNDQSGTEAVPALGFVAVLFAVLALQLTACATRVVNTNG